jgi:hypothetical protein
MGSGKKLMQTFTGRLIDVEDPSPDDVTIEDVAHALSMTCRYGGHCRDFYSVAEPSVLVEQYGNSTVGPHCDLTNELRLELLLHDAAKAYVGCLVAPVKRSMSSSVNRFDELERVWQLVIGEKFGLGQRLACPSSDLVKRCDLAVVSTEVVALFGTIQSHWWDEVWTEEPVLDGKVEISCWSPAEARRRFLCRFRSLQAGRGRLFPWSDHFWGRKEV